MKVLVILVVLVAGSWASPADSCDNSFGAFLNALHDDVVSKGKVMETEFRDDFYKLARRCFASNSNDNSRCVLTDQELRADVYGENGPMKGCSRCQILAQSWRDQVFRSDYATRKCYRTQFTEVVRKELEPCIQGKISNGNCFKVPMVPDFCEEAVSDLIEQGLGARIAVRSRLEACKIVSPAKYQSSASCMDRQHSGVYSLHRQAIRAARDKTVLRSCSARFDEVKNATCQCMEERQDDWHMRFDKIQAVLTNAKKVGDCEKQISDILGSWLDNMETAFSLCESKDIKGTARDFALRPLIKLGCAQAINEGAKKSELIIGFRFIRFVLDAMKDRVTVYCDKSCS